MERENVNGGFRKASTTKVSRAKRKECTVRKGKLSTKFGLSVLYVICGAAVALAITGCAGLDFLVGHSSASTAKAGAGSTAAAAAQNASHYDATKGPITLTGTIVREEKTTKDTQAAWSAVVYWLVLDNSVTITHKDFVGGETTNTFSRITVGQLEQYDSKADIGLASITDPTWQSYLGKTVTVSGELIDTGNTHTFGYAKFKDARVVS